MSKLTIHLDNHDQQYTVREMRRRMAGVLAKLQGEQLVSFSFIAVLEEYQPAPRNTSAHVALGAPYGLSVSSLDPYVIWGELARPEND